MISPGSRSSGAAAASAVGSWMSIWLSHCEKTDAVTKKHSSRKTTSSIGVIWKPGSSAGGVANFMALRSGAYCWNCWRGRGERSAITRSVASASRTAAC